MLFISLISIFGIVGADIICEDNGVCGDNETCCLISSNVFGCCPYPKATCCSDGFCCPNDYICDLEGHSCFRGNQKRDMLEKHPAEKVLKSTKRNVIGDKLQSNLSLELMNLGSVLCPDRCTTCPDSTTCCLLESGEYGCCPYQSAVCCNDYIHCCPYNYVCNLPSCVPNQRFEYKEFTKVTTYVKKEYVLNYFDNKNVQCPDKVSVCSEDSSCCEMSDGSYACCPYPNADCCSDGVHCCPSGYHCSLETKGCVKENLVLPMMRKQKATPIPQNIKKILNPENICPGGLYSCSSSEECCLIKQDVFGCCPQSQIVLCEDKNYYCPEHTKCDMRNFRCVASDGSFKNLLKKRLASIVKSALAERLASPILCPDKIHSCDSTYSCCLLKNGKYGCCAISNAVVCDDDIHYCPLEYKCGKTGCYNAENILASFMKIGVSKLTTICHDGATCCPNSYTCCLIGEDRYGCCPMPYATCCDDRVHCCPYGYYCNSDGTCSNGAENLGALKLLKGFSNHGIEMKDSVHTRAVVDLKSSLCPDGISQCPDGSTCCALESGQYGCCPLPNAVCCADHEHCCPQGYSCVTGGYCTQGNLRIKGSVHTEAIVKVKNVECPDGISQCPDGNTCCSLESGQYGCCPLSNAVCCVDHKHCCPQGYSCSSEGYCTQGSLRIKGSVHTKAIVKVMSVECPDGISQCPDGSTCCSLGSGQYGCCPLPNAVCCADHEHCCPKGYSCATGGYCTQGSLRIKGSVHTKAIVKVMSVECPDGISQCPDGSTCCSLGSGQYGCCPLPNAVCCADHEHCCPKGYSCATGGYCTQGSLRIKGSVHTKAIVKVMSVECPDGISQCPDGSTCCSLGSGQYGCCPLLNAVCCADHEHCCPEGYSCATGGFCTLGNLRIRGFIHTKADLKTKNVKCSGIATKGSCASDEDQLSAANAVIDYPQANENNPFGTPAKGDQLNEKTNDYVMF